MRAKQWPRARRCLARAGAASAVALPNRYRVRRTRVLRSVASTGRPAEQKPSVPDDHHEATAKEYCPKHPMPLRDFEDAEEHHDHAGKEAYAGDKGPRSHGRRCYVADFCSSTSGKSARDCVGEKVRDSRCEWAATQSQLLEPTGAFAIAYKRSDRRFRGSVPRNTIVFVGARWRGAPMRRRRGATAAGQLSWPLGCREIPLRALAWSSPWPVRVNFCTWRHVLRKWLVLDQHPLSKP